MTMTQQEFETAALLRVSCSESSEIPKKVTADVPISREARQENFEKNIAKLDGTNPQNR